MPVITPNPITVVPAKTSGGSLKNPANLIAYSAAAQGPQAELWSNVQKALKDAQSQLDGLANALRTPLGLPDPIQVVDATGNLVAAIGQYVNPSTNNSFTGIWQQISSAVAYQSAATTSLTSGSFTAISFDTNSFNFNNIHSTSVNPTRFTVPVPGLYLLQGQVEALSATGQIGIEARKNGTSAALPHIITTIFNNNATSSVAGCSGIAQLAVNDYIEFMGFQNSGGALNTVLTTTWGSIHLLSPQP